MAALADLGREIGDIANTVGPSVVGIGNRWRGGSGVVIGENRILTNAHNLHGDEVSVTFADGRTADATVAEPPTDSQAPDPAASGAIGTPARNHQAATGSAGPEQVQMQLLDRGAGGGTSSAASRARQRS